MPGKNSKLRYALDKEKGRNIRLEKQRKHEKEVAKRRQTKSDLNGVSSRAEGKVKSVDHDDIKGLREDEVYGAFGSESELELVDAEDLESLSGDDLEDDDDDDESDFEELPEDEPKRSESATGVTIAEAAVAAETQNESEEDQDDIPLSDISDVSDSEDIVPHQKLTKNNTVALTKALESIRLPVSTFPFSLHQSVTSEDPVSIPDTNDDLNRELQLYKQSLDAVKYARSVLLKEGAPFSRPSDYFAEMVKSDEHMGKVKGRLVSDAAARKASEDAKRQRQLKKFGKAVQQEKLKERAREKRETLDKVNALKRKRKDTGGVGEGQREDDMFDVEVEDAAEAERKAKRNKKEARERGKPGALNAKRQNKDAKFGFGGKKRYSKSNDAASTGDVRGFSAKKMKASEMGKKGKAPKRLGKSRRQKVS